MPKTKEELDAKRQVYIELKQLTDTKGWQEIRKILTDEFNDALETLSDPKTVKAEVEARGVIKFIKKFTDTINVKMAFGEKAQKEYVARFINPPKD